MNRHGETCTWTSAVVSSWTGSPWVVCAAGGVGADLVGRGARLTWGWGFCLAFLLRCGPHFAPWPWLLGAPTCWGVREVPGSPGPGGGRGCGSCKGHGCLRPVPKTLLQVNKVIAEKRLQVCFCGLGVGSCGWDSVAISPMRALRGHLEDGRWARDCRLSGPAQTDRCWTFYLEIIFCFCLGGVASPTSTSWL